MTKTLGFACAALIFTCLVHADEVPDTGLRDPFLPPKLEDDAAVTKLVAVLREGARLLREEKDLVAADRALHQVVGYYPDPHWEIHSLKYSNKEITDAIVDWAMELYQLRGSANDLEYGPFKGDPVDPHEYFERLLTCAQATLSPRIYDYQLGLPSGVRGELWVEYLARVKPERTLESILTAAHGSYPVNPGYLVKMPEGVVITSLPGSFNILSKMCERAPDLIMGNKKRIWTFIQANVYFYRDQERKEVTDCQVRLAALDLYALWADPAHIAEIEQLAVDVPVDHETAFRRRMADQVVEKVNRILTTKFERQ